MTRRAPPILAQEGFRDELDGVSAAVDQLAGCWMLLVGSTSLRVVKTPISKQALHINKIKQMLVVCLPSGKLTWLWKITIFIGKTHYKWPFSIAMLNYQRVGSSKEMNIPGVKKMFSLSVGFLNATSHRIFPKALSTRKPSASSGNSWLHTTSLGYQPWCPSNKKERESIPSGNELLEGDGERDPLVI